MMWIKALVLSVVAFPVWANEPKLWGTITDGTGQAIAQITLPLPTIQECEALKAALENLQGLDIALSQADSLKGGQVRLLCQGKAILIEIPQ